MSQISQLEKDLSILQSKIYKANFDILSVLPILSKEEIVKNIILQNNQAMKLHEAELMVYGYSKSLGETKPNPKYAKIYPIKKDHHLYIQSKMILNSLREAGMRLTRESSGIAQDLITTSIKIGNAVAAMGQLIAPLSFNVPAAIALLLLIIDAITHLIKRMSEVIVMLEPLKQLSLVIDVTSAMASVAIASSVSALANAAGIAGNNINTSTLSAAQSAGISPNSLNFPHIPTIGTPEYNSIFDTVVLPIDIVVKLLTALFEPISALQEIINFLLGQLHKSVKNASPTQSAPSTPFPQSAEELKDQASINKYLSQLNGLGLSQSFSIPNNLIQSTASSYSYVYDVLLPDGTSLNNLDDDTFESIKERFNVIFTPDIP
jgi:hypothetical protein